MKRLSFSTIGLLVVVVLTVVVLSWRATTQQSESERPSRSQPTMSATPTATVTTPTPGTTSATETGQDTTVFRSEAIRLVETYLTVLSTDTPESRKNRMEALNVPPAVLDTLDLTVGNSSCVDVARVDPINPLTQKPTIEDTHITISTHPLPEGSLVFVIVPVRVALYQQNGKAASNVAGCIFSGTGNIAVTWQVDSNGISTLTSLVSPEGSTL